MTVWQAGGVLLLPGPTVHISGGGCCMPSKTQSEDYADAWRAEPVGPGVFRCPPDSENDWPLR